MQENIELVSGIRRLQLVPSVGNIHKPSQDPEFQNQHFGSDGLEQVVKAISTNHMELSK